MRYSQLKTFTNELPKCSKMRNKQVDTNDLLLYMGLFAFGYIFEVINLEDHLRFFFKD